MRRVIDVLELLQVGAQPLGEAVDDRVVVLCRNLVVKVRARVRTRVRMRVAKAEMRDEGGGGEREDEG